MNRNNNDEIEIDLLKLFRALWKKALIIILIAVIFASGAFAYTLMLVTPTYQATASFYVNNSSISIGSLNYSISTGELNASASSGEYLCLSPEIQNNA